MKANASLPGPTRVPIAGLNSARNVSFGERVFSASLSKAWLARGHWNGIPPIAVVYPERVSPLSVRLTAFRPFLVPDRLNDFN